MAILSRAKHYEIPNFSCSNSNIHQLTVSADSIHSAFSTHDIPLRDGVELTLNNQTHFDSVLTSPVSTPMAILSRAKHYEIPNFSSSNSNIHQLTVPADSIQSASSTPDIPSRDGVELTFSPPLPPRKYSLDDTASSCSSETNSTNSQENLATDCILLNESADKSSAVFVSEESCSTGSIKNLDYITQSQLVLYRAADTDTDNISWLTEWDSE